jgi:uncharacterized protein (DUF433 family)
LSGQHPKTRRLTSQAKKIRRACYNSSMDYSAHITRDRGTCGGEPVIRGTRVPLRTVLASLAEGARLDEILKDYPTLPEADLRAVIAFAAASAEEDLPTAAIPTLS